MKSINIYINIYLINEEKMCSEAIIQLEKINILCMLQNDPRLLEIISPQKEKTKFQ